MLYGRECAGWVGGAGCSFEQLGSPALAGSGYSSQAKGSARHAAAAELDARKPQLLARHAVASLALDR